MTSSTDFELDIGGMTCASCAVRVEKKLNRLPGVEAHVNYATERAHISVAGDIAIDELIATIQSTGYTASTVRSEEPQESLGRRVLISAIFALPVVVLSMVPITQFDGWQWLCLALSIPVVTWGAWPFYRAAFINARHGVATMDTLITLGVLAAFGWSLYALLFTSAGEWGMRMTFHWMPMAGEIYLEVAVAVTVFILLGRFLEARAKVRASAALRHLIDLGVHEVTVLRGGAEERIPIDQLQVGDQFLVRPGEKVAADGIVDEGRSIIDTSVMTGEALPADVVPGSAVLAATINRGSALIVTATSVGSDTKLAHMIRLVAQAQAGKAPIQRLADRVSAVFVPIVLVIALLTLLGWWLAGADAEFAFSAAIAVLIIACPCALGLATPTALLVGSGRGAQLGIVIKGPEILESTRRVDVIALDKTGTLTAGNMSVVDVWTRAGWSRPMVLETAAALERRSEHPTAQAIVEASAQGNMRVQNVEGVAGSGVRGMVDDAHVAVGRIGWLVDEMGAEPPHELPDVMSAQTLVGVSVDGTVVGVIGLADTPRPTSAEAVRQFRLLGLRPMLITGDNPGVAESIAHSVGITEVIAGVLPADKAHVVAELQLSGAIVAMVGDGVNDAPALATADLSIAMGSGTDVAIEASDITLVRSDLLAAVDAIRLSRRTLSIIKGNLFWAFAYNVAAIPLAVMGLLNPLIAGIAMAGSSLFVVGNSLRLQSFKPILGSGDVGNPLTN